MSKMNTVNRHSTPGVYFNEIDETVSTQSIGITRLGIAGETLRGPAFQAIPVKKWSDYVSYFGGTSPEQFKGSKYPKYELPYIAKSYLEQSSDLQVVRVLGISGVNAGPAWVITATHHKTFNGYVYEGITYDPYATTPDSWDNTNTFDEETMPKTGEVSKDSAPYVREITGYKWHTLCGDDPKKDDPTYWDEEGTDQNSFICRNGVMDSIPDANTYGQINPENIYIRVEDTWKYELLENTTFYHYENGEYVMLESKPDAVAHRVEEIPAEYTYDYIAVQPNMPTSPMEYNNIPESMIVTCGHPMYIASKYTYVYVSDPTPSSADEKKYISYDSKPDFFDIPFSTSPAFIKIKNDGTDTYSYYHRVQIENPNFDGEVYVKVVDTYVYYELQNEYDYFRKEYHANVQLEEEDDCYGYNNMAVAVIRSRGEHKRSAFVRTPTASDIANGICDDIYEYDGIEYYAKGIQLTPSKSLVLGNNCNPGYSTTTGDFTIDSTNQGRFTIKVATRTDENGNPDFENDVKYYSVSLNSGDKNYIYNVIGGNPEKGDAEIYIEELYDSALSQLVAEGKLNAINSEVVEYPIVYIVPAFVDVDDIMTVNEASLRRSDNGRRFIYDGNLSDGIKVRYSNDEGKTWIDGNGINGVIYTVMSVINETTNKKEYFYGSYVQSLSFDWKKLDEEPNGIIWIECEQPLTDERKNSYTTEEGLPAADALSPMYVRLEMSNGSYEYYERNVTDFEAYTSAKKKTEALTPFNYATDVDSSHMFNNCVKVMADDLYYINVNGEYLSPVTLDFNNYKEQYRYASTPWIVSEVKGSAENIELNKLFRFHTISDGDTACTEVKISIENIDPETGLFDVSVRAFDDTDYNPIVLEKYQNCNLVPNTKNFIGMKIGSFDGMYESKSRYITVEVITNDITAASVPCGFLGYPVRNYDGRAVTPTITNTPIQPYFKFNTTIDEDVKVRKQYFGTSDITGIDTDILKYKGVEAYNGLPEGLTPCFHLDARILNGKAAYNTVTKQYEIVDGNNVQVVSVDGVSGYSWVTVNKSLTTDEGIEPRIGDASVMVGTIYENKDYRKFTVCMYGGFDGWDWYRTARSNGDEYTYNNYKGALNSNSGYGTMFNTLKNAEALGFDGKVITSDYYAYLGAIKQFENANSIDVNIIATPGVDYVNQPSLVNEVIDMVEESRGDAIYVVTTPDKPFGADDSEGSMYTPDDAIDNLEDSDIDTSYACTYYPWEWYYDKDNSTYVCLPLTRDVVRAIAYTDNVAYSWYAAAGWNRGNVSGIRPRRKLKTTETDKLYDGRINFISSFPNEGDKIWGDKNLQIADSQLNRISKRRLMLRIKERLSKATIGLLFDPNDPSCVKTLKMTTENVLNDIKSNRGLHAFKVEVDNSPEAMDSLERHVRFGIQVTPLLEYIYFTGTLTQSGFSFD